MTSAQIDTTSLITSAVKLAENGENWITYKAKTLQTLCAKKGVERHIAGRARKPADFIIVPPTLPTDPHKWTIDGTTALTEDQIEAHEERQDEYSLRESQIRAYLYGTIPASALIDVLHLETAADVWNALRSKYENRGIMVSADIRSQTQYTICCSIYR